MLTSDSGPSEGGKAIIGKYELGVVLAAGDFDCRTRLCRHLVTGVSYVVRIYNKHILNQSDNNWMRRRIKESIAVQRVLPKHRNVVDMVECWETEENVYILMNLFKSENLVRLFVNPKSYYYYYSPNQPPSTLRSPWSRWQYPSGEMRSPLQPQRGSSLSFLTEDSRRTSSMEHINTLPVDPQEAENFMGQLRAEESAGDVRKEKEGIPHYSTRLSRSTLQLPTSTTAAQPPNSVASSMNHIITLERIRDIFIKTVQGVLHLHHHNVAHTGLAPDHVLVNFEYKKKGLHSVQDAGAEEEEEEDEFDIFKESNFLSQQVKISNLISCLYCLHPLHGALKADSAAAAPYQEEEEENERQYFLHCGDDIDDGENKNHLNERDARWIALRRKKKKMMKMRAMSNALSEEEKKKGNRYTTNDDENPFSPLSSGRNTQNNNNNNSNNGRHPRMDGFPDEENKHMIKNELRGTRSTVAPEILKQAEPYYDPFLADSWSLGVLLYFMLMRGVYPHDGANTLTHILYHHIRPMPTQNPTFQTFPDGSTTGSLRRGGRGSGAPQPNFTIPYVCIDLVSRLLQYNPAKRLTVEGILLHPFCFLPDLRESEYYFQRYRQVQETTEGRAGSFFMNMSPSLFRHTSLHRKDSTATTTGSSSSGGMKGERDGRVRVGSIRQYIQRNSFASPTSPSAVGREETEPTSPLSQARAGQEAGPQEEWGWDPLTNHVSLHSNTTNRGLDTTTPIASASFYGSSNNNANSKKGMTPRRQQISLEVRSAIVIQRSFRIHRKRKVYYRLNEVLNTASRIFLKRLYSSIVLEEEDTGAEENRALEGGNKKENHLLHHNNNNNNNNNRGETNNNVSFDFYSERDNLIEFGFNNKIIHKYLYTVFNLKELYYPKHNESEDGHSHHNSMDTNNNNSSSTNHPDAVSSGPRSIKFTSQRSVKDGKGSTVYSNRQRASAANLNAQSKRYSFYNNNNNNNNGDNNGSVSVSGENADGGGLHSINNNSDANSTSLRANRDFMKNMLNINFGAVDPSQTEDPNLDLTTKNNTNNNSAVETRRTVARRINTVPYVFTSYQYNDNHFEETGKLK